MFSSPPLLRAGLSITAGLALALTPALAFAGVAPLTVDESLDPGASITVSKTVTTPEIPPKPDIVLLVDETGSMGASIANVQAELNSLITTVKAAQPDAQFAVASYKDEGDGADLFRVRTDLTATAATAQTAVDSLVAFGGGDEPEAQLNALWQIGNGGDAITFRANSTRIVAWFGDASGHDPSNGHSQADAITSLTDVGAQVIAIGVTGGDGLDATGQATAIAAATGGTYSGAVAPGQVAAQILAGLQNLPAEVTASTTCDTGLSVSFDPALPQTVISGSDVVFDETITVATDAPQGDTLTCTTKFLINGSDEGNDFTQTVNVTVNDVTPPTIQCGPGVNPDGVTPGNWKSSGFFQLVASDNLPGVTVSITDTTTGTTFGPYDPGTYIKLTQSVGAPASVASEFEGAVDWHFQFLGDATITATDAAGNTATASCKVPPNKK